MTRHDVLFRKMETELWEFDNGGKSIIEPYLPDRTYSRGMAVFLVDFNFCK